jgi:D-sedoheptulose 7-phosphate isomerase
MAVPREQSVPAPSRETVADPTNSRVGNFTGVGEQASPLQRRRVARVADHFAAHQQAVRASLTELEATAEAVGQALVQTLQQGGKALAFGNGGSASQASHFVGELIGRYSRPRRALPALALVADASVVTCISNDFGYGALFERQVEALATTGDLVVGLTTSGRSENVVRGLAAGRRRGARTVAMTGQAGLIGADADFVVRVPSTITASIQEVHLMLLHAWCAMVDEELRG